MPTAIGFVFILCLSGLAYWPGLSGPFLFDDFANLPAIGHFGPIETWEQLLRFVLGGYSGPTGRPVSLLTFLLDGNTWPTDPAPFKYTNIMLHLLTGTLLCWLFIKVARALGSPENQAGWIALLGTAFWLLHPLHVSTTLYVVQRMTILSALFSVAGLLCYVHGRIRLHDGRLAGYAFMTTGFMLFGTLSVLSKENGALLILFCLLIENVLFSRLAIPAGVPYWRAWRTAFLYIPNLLLFGYLASRAIRGGGFGGRDFTLGERILTEFRVVTDYIKQIALPRMHTSGLYHDNYPISTSLLTPWTTLPSIIFIICLISLGIKLRKRFPVLSLAILFYFAGHVIESTVLPLELYFEHRNYLPSVFVFFALAYYLVSLVKHNRKLISVTAAGALLGIYSTLTYARADLWGNPLMLLSVWHKTNPTSPRTIQTAANAYFEIGDLRQALEIIKEGVELYPNDAVLNLSHLFIGCASNSLTQDDFERAHASLMLDKQVPKYFHFFQHLIKQQNDPRCHGLTGPSIVTLFEAIETNPQTQRILHFKQNVLYLKGVMLLEMSRPNAAFDIFQESGALSRRPDIYLLQAAQLASHHHYELALQHLAEGRNRTSNVTKPVRIQLRNSFEQDDERFDYLERQIKKSMQESSNKRIQ